MKKSNAKSAKVAISSNKGIKAATKSKSPKFVMMAQKSKGKKFGKGGAC